MFPDSTASLSSSIFSSSDVKVRHLLGVTFDKRPSVWNIFSHQDFKHSSNSSASLTVTLSIVLVSGFIVVSQVVQDSFLQTFVPLNTDFALGLSTCNSSRIASLSSSVKAYLLTLPLLSWNRGLCKKHGLFQ